MKEVKIDLDKYKEQIKKAYPFLSDEEISELTEELYSFLLDFYFRQIDK